MSLRNGNPAEAPKIVFIGPTPPPWGGVSVHLARVSAHLEANDIPHLILSTTASGADRFIQPLGKGKVTTLLRNLRRLAGKPVIIHSSEFHGLVVAVLCTLFGARAAQHFHNGRALKTILESPMRRWIARNLLARLDRAYAVNHLIATQLRQLAGDSLRVEELHAFLPPTPGEVARSALPRGLPDGSIALGWCGITSGPRSEIYGFTFFLEVLVALRERGIPAVGIIGASDGFRPEELSGSARERASLLGSAIVPVPAQDPFVGYMRFLSVFVRPTTTDGDALSIREALALGIPVVATSVVPRPDGCVVFECGDLENCVERIAALVANPSQERHRGMAASGGGLVTGTAFDFATYEGFVRRLQLPAEVPADGFRSGSEDGR